jgi:tRNA-specific 2-thiouridylase
LRILVALSGGVDSAVAALLLREQGHDVVAAHLRTGVEAEGQGAGGTRSCCGADDARDARAVAAHLGLPFYVVDVRDAFRRDVLAPFEAAYATGLTPNPCVACNRGVKLGRLREVASGLGAAAVATGHYARVERGERGRWRLRRARDRRKDQTYVLHALGQAQLAQACFPLAELTKDEVRETARQRGLAVAGKRDSQELCFLPGADVRAYLAGTPTGLGRPGDFLDEQGRVVGRHAGAAGFTRGQRRGLPALGAPRYVAAVDPQAGTVRLAERAALDDLEVRVAGLTWTDEPEPPAGTAFDVEVQVRHAQPAVPARLTAEGEGRALVRFAQPVFAAAPGQALVAWRGDAVLCGGPIVAPLGGGLPEPGPARARDDA